MLLGRKVRVRWSIVPTLMYRHLHVAAAAATSSAVTNSTTATRRQRHRAGSSDGESLVNHLLGQIDSSRSDDVEEMQKVLSRR